MARIDLDTLRRTPAFPFGQAGHYLGLPTSTLRAWCVGQGYLNPKGPRTRFRNVIELDGTPSEGLSFMNLIEAHVLTAICRTHGLLDAMTLADSTVLRVGPDVPPGSKDEVWLRAAGSHRWDILTLDQRIRRRPLELAALQSAGVAAPAFTGRQATAEDTASAIVPRRVKFANMAISETRPFIYTFGSSGRLSRVKFKGSKST